METPRRIYGDSAETALQIDLQWIRRSVRAELHSASVGYSCGWVSEDQFFQFCFGSFFQTQDEHKC